MYFLPAAKLTWCQCWVLDSPALGAFFVPGDVKDTSVGSLWRWLHLMSFCAGAEHTTDTNTTFIIVLFRLDAVSTHFETRRTNLQLSFPLLCLNNSTYHFSRWHVKNNKTLKKRQKWSLKLFRKRLISAACVQWSISKVIKLNYQRLCAQLRNCVQLRFQYWGW